MLTETAKLLICDFLTRKILTKQKSQTLFGIWDFDLLRQFALLVSAFAGMTSLLLHSHQPVSNRNLSIYKSS